MADLDNLRRRGPRTDGGHDEHPGPRTGPRCPRARRSRPAWRLEGAARPDDAEKTPAEPTRGGEWRPGRIVRDDTPDAPGGSRMIPRLQRQRGRVRGGTILPGRQNRDPVGPPTSPTPPRSEPPPSTKRTSASESRSARGCAGAVTPLRVRRSSRCVSWCEAHASARDVPGTGGHRTSGSSESRTTSSAPRHPGSGTGAAARSPGNP